MPAVSAEALEPCAAVIRAHLERLFGRARTEYADGVVEIAWSNKLGQVNSANLFPITEAGLDEAAALAAAKNRDGANVYVGVNPRKPGTAPFGRARRADVEIAFFQFADIDTAAAVERLMSACALPYTFAVTTGRVPNPRPHVYWELDEPTRNLPAWEAQQRAIATHFGGDAVIDPPRIMRVAGTVNYPSQKKAAERGYAIEVTTLRVEYDAERGPASALQISQAYPPGPSVPPPAHPLPGPSAAPPIYDPETGEIIETNVVRLFRPEGIDPVACIRNIDAGHDLHNNARDIAAHLVGIGAADWLIHELLARVLRPVSDGGTVNQIPKLIASARQKYQRPDPGVEHSATPVDRVPFVLRPVGILVPHHRPPRQWLVPFRMMRRHITMTTAAPGVGKSTLVIEEAISMASGIDFLGHGITTPLRVAIVNNEETRDELERRIEATCARFGVPPEAIAERLFLYSGVDAEKLVIARADKNGNVIPDVNVENMRRLVAELKIDCLIIDPFVQAHLVDEGNNGQISQVMVLMRSIGSGKSETEHTAAIHLVHHNRKPVAGSSHQAGDINAGRGASSMGGEAHFFFTLADMGDDEAEKMNVSKDDRRLYLRLDDAKRKMAPASGARWFEREGVLMPYGIAGEEIGVLVPKAFDDGGEPVGAARVTEILRVIEDAWINRAAYSDQPRSTERYVVNMMVRDFNMTKTVAKRFLSAWIENGMVVTQVIDQHSKKHGLKVLKWPG